MNNQHSKLMYLGVIAVLVVGFVWMPINAADTQAQHDKKSAQAVTPGAMKTGNAHQSHIKGLGEALVAIDAAQKAIDAGDKDKALEQLAKARKLVAKSHQALTSTDRIVNARCPIMGSKLDPSKVPANLTRVYKGKKIGFCCMGCPAKWDKLSNTQRKEKLMKVAPAKSHKTKQPSVGHGDKNKDKHPSH